MNDMNASQIIERECIPPGTNKQQFLELNHGLIAYRESPFQGDDGIVAHVWFAGRKVATFVDMGGGDKPTFHRLDEWRNLPHRYFFPN